MRIQLRPGWYSRDIEDQFDLDAAGIYEWRIAGVGIYVGKALRLRSRIGAYPNNVRRILQGLPWHGNPNRDYRPIHHALRRAHDAEVMVSVVVLENCEPQVRLERENYWIKRRLDEAAAGGPVVLNVI